MDWHNNRRCANLRNVRKGAIGVSVKKQKPEMSVVHWKVGNLEGHGMPVVYWVADAWVKGMNKKYGVGTHWAVPCKPKLTVVK